MRRERERGPDPPDWEDDEDNVDYLRLSVGKRTPSSALPPPAPMVFRSARDAALARTGADQVAKLSGAAGQPLPAELAGRLGDSLGRDLSGVRVHTGAQSAAAADSLAANAFTVGRDIHFAEGTYQPDSPAGQRLIAHEVAHTVQQGTGTAPATPQTELRVSTPGDTFEREADGFADSFMRGGTPAPVAAHSGGVMLSRDENDRTPAAERTPEFFNKAGVEAVRTRASGLMLRIATLESECNALLETNKQRVLHFAAAYRDAWRTFETIVRAARQEARNQQAWKDAAEELLLAIAAAATAGVALEVAGVAEALEGASTLTNVAVGAARGAGENIATQAAHGVLHTPEVSGVDMEATGVDPDTMEMRSYRSVSDLARDLRRLPPAANSVSNLNGVAEYCIGEIKANLGEGTGGDMSERDVLDMVQAVCNAGNNLNIIQAHVDSTRVRLAGARAASEGLPEISVTEIEKDIWTRWMAELPRDSNILDLDAIENHLRELGLVTNAILWYSDADEANDIAAARERLTRMSDDHRSRERRSRDAERRAETEAREANARTAAADAALANAPESSRPVGTRTQPEAAFRRAEVEAARGIVAGVAANIAIIDSHGNRTIYNLNQTMQAYSNRYRNAWNAYSRVLAQGRQEARSNEEWTNRLTGVFLGALTG
ncbi:MAG TPA: DUF4157 domain-containing protein, partial [Kofleriaceae bacterium]|nr:DUF4157 domain-containing protein [Kofleriaceae bacterium]